MLTKRISLNKGMRGRAKRRRITRNKTLRTGEKNSAITTWLSQRQI